MEKTSKQLYDLDETLLLTDYGVLFNLQTQHYHASMGRHMPFYGGGYKYEVHRDIAHNNFIITVHPNTGKTKVPHAEFSKYGFHEVIHNIDPDPYTHVINALNSNCSTIVYWFQCDGEPSSYYDIYYSAWDIDGNDDFNPKASYTGCDSLVYLKSRMAASGLQDCRFDYRDIRKKKAYPSPYLWEHLPPVVYNKYIEYRGIPELIKQCDEEQLNRKSISDAVELYRTGGYTLEELSTKTSWKKWEIHRALTKKQL